MRPIPILIVVVVAAGFTAMMFLANGLRDVISVRRPAVPEIPADGPITLAFTGDTSFVPTVGPSGPTNELANLVRRATLAFTNLELTIEEPRRDHDHVLTSDHGKAAPSSTADALRGLGVDVVSLANSRVTGFGAEG
ncbi:MAG: CapA family protein, partial [Acidobacteriaceae bacterium]|nr:CapA family protein [Acidobacteriaceae bacterium]